MSTVPPRYEPMLATPWRRRFTDPDWVHEVKWDGVRCLLTWDGQRTVLASRNGNDMTGRYPELADFTASRPCVVDGEIIATDEADSGLLVSSLCPGWVRTDMGGPNATRSVEEGADTAVWLATLPDDGPTGGFFRDRKPIPW